MDMRVFTVTYVADISLVFYKDQAAGYYFTRVYEPVDPGHKFMSPEPAGDPIDRYVAVEWSALGDNIAQAYLIDLETGLVEDTLYQDGFTTWSKSGRKWTEGRHSLGYRLAE